MVLGLSDYAKWIHNSHTPEIASLYANTYPMGLSSEHFWAPVVIHLKQLCPGQK